MYSGASFARHDAKRPISWLGDLSEVSSSYVSARTLVSEQSGIVPRIRFLLNRELLCLIFVVKGLSCQVLDLVPT